MHGFLTSTLVGGEYPLDRRLGLDPSSDLDDVENRKILPLPGLELRPPSAVQPVAIPTELSRLTFLMFNFFICLNINCLKPEVLHRAESFCRN
jgi:hypothetical protein